MINGDGRYSRDFTYIENIIQANEKAALTSWKDIQERLRKYGTDLHCERDINPVFNIAFGGNTTLMELFQALRKNLAKYDSVIAGIEPIHGPVRAGDIPHSQASIQKAKSILNYQPGIDARLGFELVTDWYFKRFKT